MTPDEWNALSPDQQRQFIATYQPPSSENPVAPYQPTNTPTVPALSPPPTLYAQPAPHQWAPPPSPTMPPQINVNLAQSVSQSVTHAAVIVHPRRVNHVLHLVLTLLTGGLWGIVWIVAVLRARR